MSSLCTLVQGKLHRSNCAAAVISAAAVAVLVVVAAALHANSLGEAFCRTANARIAVGGRNLGS